MYGIPSSNATVFQSPVRRTSLLRSLDTFRISSDSGTMTVVTNRLRQEDSITEIIDAYKVMWMTSIVCLGKKTVLRD